MWACPLDPHPPVPTAGVGARGLRFTSPPTPDAPLRPRWSPGALRPGGGAELPLASTSCHQVCTHYYYYYSPLLTTTGRGAWPRLLPRRKGEATAMVHRRLRSGWPSALFVALMLAEAALQGTARVIDLAKDAGLVAEVRGWCWGHCCHCAPATACAGTIYEDRAGVVADPCAPLAALRFAR